VNTADLSHRDHPALDFDAAAKYLGVSGSTIRRLARSGAVNWYRVGPRLVRFSLSDLDAFLAASRVESGR